MCFISSYNLKASDEYLAVENREDEIESKDILNSGDGFSYKIREQCQELFFQIKRQMIQFRNVNSQDVQCEILMRSSNQMTYRLSYKSIKAQCSISINSIGANCYLK